MTENDGGLQLAGPNDAWGVADWEAETAKVLRKTRRLGEDDADSLVWDKLTRTTLDGIAVTPLGQPSDLDDLATHGRPTRSGPWDIRAHHGVVGVEAKAAHESLLGDLEGGVTSLWLGVDADTDLDTLLDGVYLDLAPVVLDAPSAPVAAAERFVAHLESTSPAAGTNLGVDAMAAESDLVAVARLAREAGVLGVVVDATAVHDRGASDVQELAWSLAAGVRVLRVLAEAGIENPAELIEFRYAVTDEQFPSIAKLRAARRLWTQVLSISGLEVTSPAQRQHAVTSRPMLSTYDPYVNMLRTTVAAFAGGVGGAESVTVLPFDAPLGRPEAFGRRIARNINHLLIDEAHLGKVTDMAGGAYAVEKLTDDIAVAAWSVFGDLDEAAGTDAAALESAIAPLIEQTVAAREQLVAARKRPITGVSEFPNLAETLPERQPDGAWEHVRPYGASFEALRADPAARPVFLATLGTVAQHTARATFAINLFAAGGVAADVAGPTSGVDDLVAAYAGQPVVCLAGSDAAYGEWGQAAAEALRAAGAVRVIIAGKPTDYTDDSCAMGLDALAFLHRTREALA